jgi:non-homologous end joining protein Ku
VSKVTRASASTTLKIGSIETPISLYKLTGDGAKSRKWELANAAGEPWDATRDAFPNRQKPEDDDPHGAAAEDALGSEGEMGVQSPPAAEGGAPMGGAVPGASSSAPSDEEEKEEEPVKPRKGIRKDDGAFVDLTDQIEAISEETTLERAEVISFIDQRHIPRERITAAYYLAGGDGEGLPPTRVLAIVTAAMRETGKVAVVRFTKRKGQTLGILTRRRDGALILLEVVFSAQVREPNARCLAHVHVGVRPEEMAAAAELIEAMSGRRESLDSIRDRQVVLTEELVTRAEHGELDEYEPLIPDTEMDAQTEQLGDLLRRAAATV